MTTSLNRLLRPKSIAVIGGSEAANVVEQCMAIGFEGEIWPVHPTKDEVHGQRVYRSVDELPCPPDAAFVAVNRRRTIAVVDALARCGAGGAICYASGFTEADGEGRKLQHALINAAGDMPVIGPNCYGLLNYADGVALWPDQHGGVRLAEGKSGVAIITQSSNIAANITMQRRGLPIAYVLTAGNQAQTGLSQMALNLLEDSRVTALGLHIEGFDCIRGMEQVARKARALKKPVVAMKIGRSNKARQAAFTHTASLAGSDAAAHAFLKRISIARLNSIPSFLETLKLLHVHGPLDGFDISSMSCSGGEASLIADASHGRKIHFPNLSHAQKKPISDALGPMVSIANPLDYHTYIWGNRQSMEATFTGMLSAGFDLNCLILDFPRCDRCNGEDWQIATDGFVTAARQTGTKAAIVTTLHENISEEQSVKLVNQGIAPMLGIDETLDAIEAAAAIGEAWKQPEPQPVEIPSVRKTIAEFVPDEAEAKQILSGYGIPVPIGQKPNNPDEIIEAAEKIGFPVVLKALGIAHKSELNALRLDLGDVRAVRLATNELVHISPELYVEEMITNSVFELLVGLLLDEQFGLVMTIATGGRMVEVLGDSQTLLLPARKSTIEQALRKLKSGVFFDGFRGGVKADLAATISTILSVQDFALENSGSLLELDINPLIVRPVADGVVAADALIKFGRPE